MDQLTTKEREVLNLMAEGHSNLGIAGHLQLSMKTVERYISTMYQKLQVTGQENVHPRVKVVVQHILNRSRRA